LKIYSVDRQLLRVATRSQDQLVIRNLLSLVRLNGLALRVDLGHFNAELQLHLELVLELGFGSPSELGRISDQRFGQLGSVDGDVILLGDQGDLAFESVFPQRLDRMQTSRSTTDNDDLLILGFMVRWGDRTLGLVSDCRSVLLGLGSSDRRTSDFARDGLQVGSDVDLAVLYVGAVCVQTVQTGSIFDVSGTSIETGTVPWARNSTSLMMQMVRCK